jgi:hypothetical protein
MPQFNPAIDDPFSQLNGEGLNGPNAIAGGQTPGGNFSGSLIEFLKGMATLGPASNTINDAGMRQMMGDGTPAVNRGIPGSIDNGVSQPPANPDGLDRLLGEVTASSNDPQLLGDVSLNPASSFTPPMPREKPPVPQGAAPITPSAALPIESDVGIGAGLQRQPQNDPLDLLQMLFGNPDPSLEGNLTIGMPGSGGIVNNNPDAAVEEGKARNAAQLRAIFDFLSPSSQINTSRGLPLGF